MRSIIETSHGGNHRRMALGNSVTVLKHVYRQALISQRQIIEQTGMQPSTVSNIIRELKAAGIVRESGTLEAAGVGAKQVSLEINASFAWVASWHIDLMGQRICLLDAAGHIVAIENFPSDFNCWQTIANSIHERIAALAETRRLPMNRYAGLGIAVQGIVDSDRGEVIYSHPHNMKAVPLREMISGKQKGLIHVERDTCCGAYLEQNIVPMGEEKSFLYFLQRKYETFFSHGASIVLNGKIYFGRKSVAGELPLELFSTPPFETLKTEKDWDDLYRSFGKPMAMLADFLDVDEIILSSEDQGLTSRRFQLIQQEVQSIVRPLQGRSITVTQSQSGPDGILIGAGLMVLHQYFQRFALTLPNRSMARKKTKAI